MNLAAHSPRPRVVLFLQGPPSAFWAELGEAVRAAGGRVLKVHVCLGDRLFWRGGGAVDWRGPLRAWPRWLRGFLIREGVTDIVYYADRQPYHRLAAAVARRLGIGAHAVEFGYLRPDWLTLEQGGNGAQSRFPDAPEALRPDLPAPDMTVRYPHPFWREALGEVTFNLATVAGWPLYPRHAADKPVHPVADYLAWLLKLARGGGARRRAADVVARWTAGGAPPFFLVGLQLPTDYQIRHSAWFADQRAMVRAVVRSFAAHAPADTRLLFKTHPLDNGWTRWRAVAAAEAAARGIADRVETIEAGDLGLLMRRSRGVVVANSTVGLLGLREGVPVKALGAAVYAMPGLTDPAPLGTFWQAPQAPDPALVAAFVATLAAETQVKGSIYAPAGRRLAARTIAGRLVEGRVGPAGAPSRPPRLAPLRAMRRALAEGRAEP